MIRQTFEKMVWEIVNSKRGQTVVVDNSHAYGIIQYQVDAFWEQVRHMDPEDDQLVILSSLAAIAAHAQLAAESLMLVSAQIDYDNRHEASDAKAARALNLCSDFVNMLDCEKVPVRSLQRDTPRFAFEFDSGLLESLRLEIGVC